MWKEFTNFAADLFTLKPIKQDKNMKIKLLFAVLAVSAFMCVPAQAQDKMETRHEIAVSYGTLPNSIWVDAYTSIIESMFGEKKDSYRFVGPVGLEYYYHTSPVLGIGAVATFTTNKQNGFYEEEKITNTTRSYFSFLPSIKVNWLRKDNWGMYSKVAAGVTYAHFNKKSCVSNDQETVNDLLFNFHVSLLGIEAGSQHVRGFAELGVGEQGVALAGVRFKF